MWFPGGNLCSRTVPAARSYIKCSFITINAESIAINVAPSKTDQYKEGSSLVVARTGTETCPVNMLERYFTMGGLCHTAHVRC